MSCPGPLLRLACLGGGRSGPGSPLPGLGLLLRGASEVRRSPSPDCPPIGRAVGVRYPRAVGAGVWVWGPNTVPLACMHCGGCGGGPSPGGGWPATVVRGVWCQALSLPRPPVLWGGQPGYRDPCVRVRSVRAWGPSTGSTACALAGRRCSLWGWRKGVPGGGAFHRCEERLRSGAPPPPTARPLGGPLESATHVLWARVCGCGGPTLSPWPACPVGAACRGGGGGPSPGGVACHRCEGRLRSGAPPPPTARPLGGPLGSATHVLWARVCGCGGPTLSPWPACPVGAACRGGGWGPSPGGVACHRCEGRLVSGAVPPPAARPLGRAAGVPRPVCPGCGRCGCGDQAPAPRRAPLRAGVARRGGGGRASPGGVPSAVVRGVWGQVLPLPRLPALWAGCRGPLPTGCGCGGVRVWGPVTNPTARALASWLCALWGRHEGARGGRLLPGCGASGVGRSPGPDCPPSGRAAGAHYPLAVGAGGSGRGDPSPIPQRALLRATGAA